MQHIVNECPLRSFPGGLAVLNEAGPDAVEYLRREERYFRKNGKIPKMVNFERSPRDLYKPNIKNSCNQILLLQILQILNVKNEKIRLKTKK
jgi:hypothetical protein